MIIEDAVKAHGKPIFLYKGSIKAAEQMLTPNEELLYANIVNMAIYPVTGGLQPNVLNTKGKLAGVLVVTSKRVFFCNNVLGKGTSKQILITAIQSIDNVSSLIGSAKLRITGMTEMFVVDGTPKSIAAIHTAINTAQF